MKKFIPIAACFLIFQTVVLVHAVHATDVGVQKSDFPRALLPKPDSSVTIWKQGEAITVVSNKSTLEEILERIAVEKKVTLKFYCQDPSLKRERVRDLKVSGDSLEKVLRQLLSEEHRFTFLNREGKPAEDGKDIATVNIYSKGCAETDPPVRVFRAEREEALLRRSPEEITLEQLQDALKTGGPVSRRRAVDILGKKADEKGIAYAKEALKDENPGVMFAAATALSRLGQKYGAEKVADDIYARFREKPYVEFLLVMAVVDKNRLWPVIDALIDHSGEREKGIMVRVLSTTQDARAVKYLSRISSTSTENSKQAIYVIGRIGGPEAATALIRLLRGRDVMRQAWAAQAIHFLSKEDGRQARAEVEKVVKGERVPDALLQALAEVSYLEPLRKLMEDPAVKKELKIRALQAMSRKGGERSIEVMGVGLNDKAFQVRLACVEAMTPLAVDGAIPYLIKATKDEDAKVRRSAIKGLAEFPGDDNAIEALGKAIDDPNETVRRGAVDALRLMGEPNEKMKAILDNCMKHKDPYIVDKASSIMRYWGLMN